MDGAGRTVPAGLAGGMAGNAAGNSAGTAAAGPWLADGWCAAVRHWRRWQRKANAARLLALAREYEPGQVGFAADLREALRRSQGGPGQ
jgi:hypothetical protein